jgi:hypothetical protein
MKTALGPPIRYGYDEVLPVLRRELDKILGGQS